MSTRRLISRNSTDRSRLCNALVGSFLKSGRPAASVGWERTPYAQGVLYKGLANACGKEAYKGRVRVSKRDGGLFLVRCG